MASDEIPGDEKRDEYLKTVTEPVERPVPATNLASGDWELLEKIFDPEQANPEPHVRDERESPGGFPNARFLSLDTLPLTAASRTNPTAMVVTSDVNPVTVNAPTDPVHRPGGGPYVLGGTDPNLYAFQRWYGQVQYDADHRADLAIAGTDASYGQRMPITPVASRALRVDVAPFYVGGTYGAAIECLVATGQFPQPGQWVGVTRVLIHDLDDPDIAVRDYVTEILGPVDRQATPDHNTSEWYYTGGDVFGPPYNKAASVTLTSANWSGPGNNNQGHWLAVNYDPGQFQGMFEMRAWVLVNLVSVRFTPPEVYVYLGDANAPLAYHGAAYRMGVFIHHMELGLPCIGGSPGGVNWGINVRGSASPGLGSLLVQLEDVYVRAVNVRKPI